jgi:S1-C subfamily serine protease
MQTFKLFLVAIVASASTLGLAAGCDVVRSTLAPTPIVEPAPQLAGGSTGAPPQPQAAAPQSVAPPVVAAVPVAPVALAATTAQSVVPGAADASIRVYKDVSPSVVTVVGSTVRAGFRQEPTPSGTGSGFMIDGDGRILTNNHVVDDADKLEVSLPDGSTIPAELIGRDPRFDVAVIKANIPPALLKPVKMADSDAVEIGELAIAIGNPFGLERTITMGIVSARRPIVAEPGGFGVLVNAIQTDAAINPGNSGGPLLNARGEVIGINTLGRVGPGGSQAGLNFAIPINNAKLVMNDLIKSGKYAHPFVGIASADITQAIAEQLKLPVKEGLLIQSVEPNSGGARAGLRGGGGAQETVRSRQIATGGDIVTAIDGIKVKRPEDFVAYLELNKKAGDRVMLTIVRDGQTRDIEVTLGERPIPQGTR